METRLKDKRRTPAVKEGKAPPLRRGRYGALQHDRLGLIGAVCYWARGYKQNVVRLIKKVIHAFGVEKDISAHLFKKTRREAETDHLITERLVAAIDVLKECRSEQQRLDFRFALSLVAQADRRLRSSRCADADCGARSCVRAVDLARDHLRFTLARQ